MCPEYIRDLIILWSLFGGIAIFILYMRHKGGKILPTKKEYGHIIAMPVLIIFIFSILIIQELWPINQRLLSGIFLGFLIFYTMFTTTISEYILSKEQYKNRALILSFAVTLIGIIGLVFFIPMINLISYYMAYLVLTKYSKKIGVALVIGAVAGYVLCLIFAIFYWALDLVTFLSKPEFSLSTILLFIPLIIELMRKSHMISFKKKL